MQLRIDRRVCETKQMLFTPTLLKHEKVIDSILLSKLNLLWFPLNSLRAFPATWMEKQIEFILKMNIPA